MDMGARESGISFPMRLKLLLAFLGLSIPLMLLAAFLASRAAYDVYEHNVTAWQKEATDSFLKAFHNDQKEAEHAAAFLLERFLVESRAQTDFEGLGQRLGHMASDDGYETLILMDQDGEVRYGPIPAGSFKAYSLQEGIGLFVLERVQGPRVLLGAIRPFRFQGEPMRLFLGNPFAPGTMEGFEDLPFLEVRLYILEGKRLRGAYSSNGTFPIATLGESVLQGLAQKGGLLLLKDQQEGFMASLRPLRDKEGTLRAALFVGLRQKANLPYGIAPRHVFLSVFFIGALVSFVFATLLSRSLSAPIRNLAKAALAIRWGDYAQRIEAKGRDEIAYLARTFNQMAQKLQELKRLEAELSLKERIGTMGELALGIAHEVRNPLGIIKASAQLIQRKGELEPSLARLMGQLIEQVDRIEALLSNFLRFGRPSTETHFALLGPKALIERCLKFCELKLKEQKVQASIEDFSSGAKILADEALVFEAALNIVLNAMEAMPQGGSLKVRLEREDGSLLMSFQDTGHGIPQALRERILEPFFTTKPSGTGLGLTRVYHVMQAHLGNVRVGTKDGEGAVFTLVFPIAGMDG
jgi:signal transduction histidine kinase